MTDGRMQAAIIRDPNDVDAVRYVVSRYHHVEVRFDKKA